MHFSILNKTFQMRERLEWNISISFDFAAGSADICRGCCTIVHDHHPSSSFFLDSIAFTEGALQYLDKAAATDDSVDMSSTRSGGGS